MRTDVRKAGRAAVTALVLLFAAVPASAVIPGLGGNGSVPTLAPLLEKVTPAVVNVSVRSRAPIEESPLFRDPFFRRFFDLPELPPTAPRLSAGSGVIIDAENGYVLTNHHVIANSEEIVVTLKDRRNLEATLVGSDPGTDIALLKIQPGRLTALSLGDSDALKVGDFVVAIGNPFGLGQTVTLGIVSALGRSGLKIEGYEDFIQTDASINPGNSGGALITLKGELIGINTAIIGPAGGNVGIGFAVPIRMAKAVTDQLLKFGEVRRGRLGITIQDLTPDNAEAMGLDISEGAVITQVVSDSPAARAGLRAGDVVVAVDGRPVRGSSDLRNRVGLTPVGEKIELTLLRDGRRITVGARVGKAEPAKVEENTAIPQLPGVALDDIAPGMPGYGKVKGALVAAVRQGSAAWRHGLRPGDVIVAVNRREVDSVDALKNEIARAGRVAVLKLRRDEATLYIVIP